MELKRFSLGDVAPSQPPAALAIPQKKAQIPVPEKKAPETVATVSLPISKFYEEEFVQFGVYNNYRMLGNWGDGGKPSERKIWHTVQKMNLTKNMKVATLKGIVATTTHYHHGEDNLAGVICGMAAKYTGANNLNMLYPVGNHGSRCSHEPAADRYIETRKADVFDLVFHPDDTPILPKQYDGDEEIEPVHFAPIIPLLLVNGSEGMGLGFAQKILPRLPQNIIKAIYAKMEGSAVADKLLYPGFVGFDGRVTPGEEQNQWKIQGVWAKNEGRFVGLSVTELPPSYDHEGYLQKLDALVDRGDIIDYTDRTDPKKGDFFSFELKTTRAFMERPNEEVANSLGIVQTVTENFTCMDERNSIELFPNVQALFDRWFVWRLKIYDKRRDHLLKVAKDNYRKTEIKFNFINDLMEGNLVLKGKSYDDAKKEINERYKAPDLTSSLLQIPVSAQTNERLGELLDELESIEGEIERLNKIKGIDLWRQDLQALEKYIAAADRKRK